MTEKNVLLGFVLATTILFMNSNFLFIGIVIDLLVIAGYLLSKYLYLAYKIDGNYLERIYMVPLHLTLIMAILTAGIFSIISRYAILLSNFSAFYSLSLALKIYVFAEIIFLIIFTYFLFKTILFEIIKINIPKDNQSIRAPQKKIKNTKTSNTKDAETTQLENDTSSIFKTTEEPKEEKDELYPYQVKKLPVVVIIEKE